MSKSIKNRLIVNFVIIIFIAVTIFEFILINAIKELYYRNIENVLTTQIEHSVDYFLRYFALSNLNEVILDDVNVFWQHTNSQVQIFDTKGSLLLDSIGVNNANNRLENDIKTALNGKKGVWIGKVKYNEDVVLAVSMPIVGEGMNYGIIRFITSLSNVNSRLNKINMFLLIIGIIVIIISIIISYFIANSIVRPLKKVTKSAEKMANGELSVQIDVDNDDEIGKLSSTLNYMANELVKKDQIKNDFISSISHELKTPLTSIKGWAITLKDEDVHGSTIIYDGLDIIENESDRLTNLVNDLLDFSRFISGRITLNKEYFYIDEMIKTTIKQLNPKANNKGINLSFEEVCNVGEVLADKNRMKQVLINILDNSIKFSFEGDTIITKLYLDFDKVVIEVIDSGIGISPEDIPRIKDKFFKGNNKMSHSGIGLSICDEIIELHSGSIDIYSELNKGTRVVITIPLWRKNNE